MDKRENSWVEIKSLIEITIMLIHLIIYKIRFLTNHPYRAASAGKRTLWSKTADAMEKAKRQDRKGQRPMTEEQKAELKKLTKQNGSPEKDCSMRLKS